MSPSPSGFASLRARFEQNQQDNNTSPPSRGRSPADSRVGDTSRPVSKVRTSFVAVEPSGNMVPTLEVPTSLSSASDGSNESKLAVASGKSEQESRFNGVVTDSEHDTPSNRAESGPYPTLTKEAKPDSLALGAETNLSKEQLLPKKSEDSEGLGPILKGSPFEAEEVKKESVPQENNTKLQASTPPLKDTEPSTAINTSKEVLQSASQPAKKGASSSASGLYGTQKAAAGPAGSPKSSINGKPKEATSMEPSIKPKVQALKANEVQKESSVTSPTTKAPSLYSSSKKMTNKSAGVPCTPITPIIPSEESPRSTASTKPIPKLTSSEPKKSPRQPKEPVQKVKNGLSTTKKAHGASNKSATSKATSPTSTTSVPVKKTAPSNPPGNAKPQPKSPTRAVKLPAAAMAPTTSSAAKHDGEDTVIRRLLSGQGTSSATVKGRRTSLSKPSTSVRASLPANSRPMDKPKPKPRTSMASTTGPSEGFLERMMRPTQSSAQKTHDKVEPKSPPRKTAQSGHTSKPKRKSGESVGNKSETKDLGLIGESKVDSQEESNTKKGIESTDVQPPLPLTDSTATKSDEDLKNGEGATSTVIADTGPNQPTTTI